MRQIWLLFLLLLCPLSAVAGVDEMMIAEFRADRDAVPERIPELLRGTSQIYAAEDTYVSTSAHDPLFSTLQEISSVWLHPLPVGSQALLAELDFKFRQTLSGQQWYRQSHGFRVGPRLSLWPGSVLRLYYGISQETALPDAELIGDVVYTERSSTGVAQTWYIGSWDSEFELGYEYEQGLGEALYEGSEGHRINLSGRFPLLWGFNADVEAGFGRYTYPEYNGSLDLQSDRLSVIAAISRPFGRRLSGSLRYLYADEEFADAPFGYRRHAWGLNLRYRY